jgi:hypothetical protein
MHRCLMLATALIAFGVAACAENAPRPAPLDGASAANPRARDAGRAAGAGGSHAPGSTGLGSGTQGVRGTAAIGSAR